MSATFEAVVHELTRALTGMNATKYLSPLNMSVLPVVAGVVVLLYDHLLLLDAEIRLIWRAERCFTKGLFLLNRYLVPACLLINMHMLSGLSTAGLSTKTWLPISAFIGITSLAVANIFVVQRVWTLWARNKTILKILVGAFICVYTVTYAASAVAFVQLIPHLSFLPSAKTCIVDEKPDILIVMYAVPIALDVFVFTLTCWNAFDRPRHMQADITRQLVTDGVVYFVCLMTLRLFNILIIAAADASYSQLGVYFLWAMITVLINRMLIMNGTVEVHPGSDPSGRQTPFKLPNRGSYAGNDDDGYIDDDETEMYMFPSHKTQVV